MPWPQPVTHCWLRRAEYDSLHHQDATIPFQLVSNVVTRHSKEPTPKKATARIKLICTLPKAQKNFLHDLFLHDLFCFMWAEQMGGHRINHRGIVVIQGVKATTSPLHRRVTRKSSFSSVWAGGRSCTMAMLSIQEAVGWAGRRDYITASVRRKLRLSRFGYEGHDSLYAMLANIPRKDFELA